jgi:hypothetical protein
MAKEIVAKYPKGSLVILLVTFSDDFQAQFSDRNSVWMKVVTIVQPIYNRNDYYASYPVALALKGKDHEPCERKFAEELKESSDPHNFWCPCWKRLNANVRTFVNVIACLKDQPEKHGMLHIRGGNSNYGAIFRHSIDLRPLRNQFPSCTKCFKHRLDGGLFRECDDCYDWNHQSKRPVVFPPPKGYPTLSYDEVMFLGYEKWVEKPIMAWRNVVKALCCHEITYETLRFAVTAAHDNVYRGMWTESEAKVFLAVECVEEKTITKIVNNAANMKILDETIKM